MKITLETAKGRSWLEITPELDQDAKAVHGIDIACVLSSVMIAEANLGNYGEFTMTIEKLDQAKAPVHGNLKMTIKRTDKV